MSRILASLIILFALNGLTGAQSSVRIPLTFSYDDPRGIWFEGALGNRADGDLPAFATTPEGIDTPGRLKVAIQVDAEEEINPTDPDLHLQLAKDYPASGVVYQERHRCVARVTVCPLRRDAEGRVYRLISGQALVAHTPALGAGGQRSGPDFKTSSALASGRVYKLSVDRAGVFRVDYNFIKEKLGLDPASLDVSRIGIYGNGGGRIPQAIAEFRIDDIEPCAVQAAGLDDGRFDAGDYLLWYAEGPDKWSFDSETGTYQMEKNIYDIQNHYYLLLDGPGSPKMEMRPDGTGSVFLSAASLEAQRLEEEKVNLLGRYRPPGSGQEWYGDELAVVTQLEYANRFDFTDLVTSDSLHFKLRFAIRSATSPRLYFRVNEQEFSRGVGSVNLDNYESSFANDGVLAGGIIPGKAISQLLVRYPQASGVNSRAWVDYLQLAFWRHNTYRAGKPLVVRDPRARFLGTPTYQVNGLPAGAEIWDITYPQLPLRQQYQAGQVATFTGPAPDGDVPAVYICFDPARDAVVPAYGGRVTNQNLHSLTTADLVIVYSDDFGEAAEALAAHRRAHDGYEVVAVPTRQIYEEFGGGSKDPSALRDFTRMLYGRDPGFNYLLLIGDATYDYLQRDPELPYHNYVPAFETEESLDPIRSFPSDDFYALLDEQEGATLVGAIDIAVGRLPVSSLEEANSLVQKIIHYDKSPRTLGDWRNRIMMVADDQDGNIHLNQADALAKRTTLNAPALNQEKLYLDAFPQESTPGGDRYPTVNTTLDQSLQKGLLTVTYMGHGGPNGWTQERVLGINQAQRYQNLDNLPLFITATCSFAGYDEPAFVSAGEHLLSNPTGGAIALMTTVRAVFSGSNARLTQAVLDRLYTSDAFGEYPPIGEVLRRAKNDNALDTLDNNARKFTLLGDPSMRLAIPRFRVQVVQVGQVQVASGLQDTLSALEKTVVRGIVTDDAGQRMEDFQGRVYLTLFDKIQKRSTLGNDADSPVREFETQNKQLFRGTASVVNGAWAIEFVLPKDIDFAYGPGRMSLYAEDGETDAAGLFTGFLVGGVSGEGLADDQPPLVKAFMNDEHFVSGGITDADPDIFLQLSDDNGINVSGTSIGHDIEGVLDGDARNALILNDYYQAAQDDYRSGTVRYPLQGLAPGRHTLEVTAWDLANNPGQAFVEFVVLDEAGPVVTNVGADPNPFDGETRFHFEHNRPGDVMDAQLRIFDLRGALVRTLALNDLPVNGYRVDEFVWDGTNQAGAEVPPGLYVYRLQVTFSGSGAPQQVDAGAGKVIRL